MSQFIKSLQKVLSEHIYLKNFSYFINQTLRWYRKVTGGQIKRGIVILGTQIPQELLMAVGSEITYVLGGDLEICEWSDNLVPRDTDPVSRSMLGYIQRLGGSDQENRLLYIVPACSDSMRKIASQLKRDNKKVFVLDYFPDRNDPGSAEKWSDQLYCMMCTAADHVKRKLSADLLYESVRVTSRARICLHEFLMKAQENDRVISPAARILIQNSYYYTDDLETWTFRLRALMGEIELRSEKMQIAANDDPGILLMGSPVFFPNDKVIRLISESGLRIIHHEDVSNNIQYILPKTGKDRRNLHKMTYSVAREWFLKDGFNAYLKNDATRRMIRSVIDSGQIEGIVYHVLKGQIEYDFELPYYEELLEAKEIPIFRLETDYQYQDLEQLRIRIEAFAEMLGHRKKIKGHNEKAG